MADDESIEYFVRRAEEERDAAACANNDAARQIHVELANEYLSRASQKRGRRKLGITVS